MMKTNNKAVADTSMNLSFLVPCPQNVLEGKKRFLRPASVRVIPQASGSTAAGMLIKDLRTLANIRVTATAPYSIRLRLRSAGLRPEGYRLEIGPKQTVITGADAAGLFYGTQTLLQLAVMGPSKSWPELTIEDWPHYRWRSYMVDMGRSVFRLPLLKRMIRILARLKMNVLHLHLNDDQLNGLRLARLPLGSENPQAITLGQLRDLIRYARGYHVTIMPEIECWGHAGSFAFHYPHLRGGAGMFAGSSFGIGPELFAFFEKVFDEVVAVLEPECHVHVGLDEAIWALLPSVPPQDRARYSPENLVEKLYDIVQKAARKHGKRLTMHMWADHKGRAIPKRLSNKLVLHPWRYLQRNEQDIKGKLQRLGGQGKPRLVCGSGTGLGQMGAHFLSTRIWSRLAAEVPNVLGITLCQWNGNDIAEQLVGIYAGADYLWSPLTPQDTKDDPYHEILTYRMCQDLRNWQTKIKDGDEEAILIDRGPLVCNGFYSFGPRAGLPVAPTATWNRQWDVVDGMDG